MNAMVNQLSSETLVQYASDLIHWVEGSGPISQQSRPMTGGIENNLKIELITAPLKLDPDNIAIADRTPSDLFITNKPGLTVLWRLNAANNQTLSYVQNSSDSVLSRPIEEPYKVTGIISDKQNRINPREFHLTHAGNFIDVNDPLAKGHEIKLYRSVLGSKNG